MADWLANTCEGTSGTTASTVNSAGPNQFDSLVITGAGSTGVWDNAQAHTGVTSLKLTLITSVLSSSTIDWTASVSPTPVANAYMRFYFFITAYPTVNSVLGKWIGSAAAQGTIRMTTTGTIALINHAGSIVSTTTAAIPLSAWCRIEFDCTANNGTTANLALRLFSGANLEGSTPDSGGSLTSSAQATSAQTATCRFGTSSTVTETATWSSWWDDMAFSDTSSPGPLLRDSIIIAAPLLTRGVPLLIPGQIIGTPPASAGTSVTAGLATGTAGAALLAGPAVGATAGLATGTAGAALAAAPAVAVTAGLATGTGAALSAPMVIAAAGLATATAAAALDASVSTSGNTNATAGLAAGTAGAALIAAPAIGVTAGLAAGTAGAALLAAPAISVAAGLATGTAGAALGIGSSFSLTAAGLATGTAGAALNATVSTGVTASVSAIVQAPALPQVVYGIASYVLSVQPTAPGISITAGVASATGAALIAPGVMAGLATATGAAALIAAPAAGVTAGLATGTAAAAQNPSPAVSVTAGLATGTGTAQTAPMVIAAAGLATGTGAARAPAPAAGVTAGVAIGADSALAAAPAAGVTAGLATGTGTAQPAPMVIAAAGLATGTGTAQPVAMVIAAAGFATGTGTAQQPSVSTTGNTNVNAGVATGTGTAQAPPPAVGVTAGLATGTAGAALDATATAGVTAGLATATGAAALIAAPAIGVTAGLATGADAALTAAPAVAVTAGLATGTGTAQQPSVSTTGNTNVSAGFAQGTGAALTPAATVNVTVTVTVTVAAGTALGAVLAVTVTAAAAAAQAAARQPAATGTTGATGTVLWKAHPAKPRWIAEPAQPRWRIAMAPFAPISALSLEMVNVTWTSDLDGTTVDPTGATTGEAALTVQFAFPLSSGIYAAPAQPTVWFAGSWLLGGTGRGYVAQCLIGPGGGAVTLTAGQQYDTWAEVLGTPESPRKFAGVLPAY